MRWYGAVSGSAMGYGFFAPSVGAQMRARFVLSNGAGSTWEDDFTSGHNQEVRLRVGSIVTMFPAEEDRQLLRDDLLSCWAVAMFARHPDANGVTIYLEAYDVPSMAGYRAGARPTWVPVWTAKFNRDEEKRKSR